MFWLQPEPRKRSSAKIGTIQRRLAWPLRKDDTHKSRMYHFCILDGITILYPRGNFAGFKIPWSYSVMVITKDFESFDPGSSPGRTFLLFIFQIENCLQNKIPDAELLPRWRN